MRTSMSFVTLLMFALAYVYGYQLNAFKTDALKSYFDRPLFVLVGAPEDKTHIGNFLLRCFLACDRECLVLNKRVSKIENTPTIANFGALEATLKKSYPDVETSQVGVNFITPPDVTTMLIRDAYQFGVRNFFCQPETIDEVSRDMLMREYTDVNIIEDCAINYQYFDFFSDPTNLDSISEYRKKLLHSIEWLEDEQNELLRES